MKAILNGTVIAESNDTILIESDHYFPVESINMDFLKKGNKIAVCDSHGDACYYDVVVNGKVVKDAASSFNQPSEASEEMRDYIVFKSPVEIVD